jgi:hypothetical protein
MARRSLRPHLNQIRGWVRQGRTDAWIAHQLEVSTSELREFRRRHELNAEDEADEGDLRDEIEAEIEAATREEELAAENDDEDDDSDDDEDSSDSDDDGDGDSRGSGDGDSRGSGDGDGGQARKPRRRRRRGGRGRGRTGASMQASFDHGEEGYGLWLDPAIADDPVYTEHWAGHRPVEVTVEPDRIVIKRTGDDAGGEANGDSDSGSGPDSDED